jgi:hypothetical protein
MICPKCNFEQAGGNTEYLKCGIIFEKYRQYQDPGPTTNASPTEYEERAASFGELSRNLLFYVKPETNPLILGVRVLFFLVILIWGLKFIFTSMETNYVGESFWHLVTAFVGLNLLQSTFTKWCLMENILSKLGLAKKPNL